MTTEPAGQAAQSSRARPIHKFNVAQLKQDRWQATATYELTDYLADLGCRSVIRTETFPDLDLLCAAERIRAGMARGAEERAGGRP